MGATRATLGGDQAPLCLFRQVYLKPRFLQDTWVKAPHWFSRLTGSVVHSGYIPDSSGGASPQETLVRWRQGRSPSPATKEVNTQSLNPGRAPRKCCRNRENYEQGVGHRDLWREKQRLLMPAPAQRIRIQRLSPERSRALPTVLSLQVLKVTTFSYWLTSGVAHAPNAATSLESPTLLEYKKLCFL